MDTLRAWLFALTASTAACTPQSGVSLRHIVVVVLDATHAAHLGCYGGPPATSPTLDGLAARGVRFEHAYANTTWTLASTMSLMTGLRQESHGVVREEHRAPDDAVLLAEHLQVAGFDTAALVQMPFASARYGLDQGATTARYYGPRDGAERTELQHDVLAWLARRDRPSFLYLHLRRPHMPFDPGARARAALGVDPQLAAVTMIRDTSQLTPTQGDELVQLYRANIRHVDDHLAEVIRILQPHLATDTLLVVLSDHGEGFGQHGDFGHGPRVFDEHLRIPMLFIGPGIEPGVCSAPVSTVDVLPTVLELAGLPRPAHLDGRSLVPWLEEPGRAPDGRPVLASARRMVGKVPDVAVVTADFKLVLAGDGSLTLTDRAADPGETRDVAGKHPDVVSRLRALATPLQAWQSPEGRDGQRPEGLDEDLRELGYLR